MTIRFRLEPVLEMRRRRTEALEREFAALERQRLERVAAIDALRAELATTRAGLLARLGSGKLDLRAMAQAQAYAERLERRIAAEEMSLADLVARCDAKRRELVGAHQEQKAIEKLKERYQARSAEEARTQEIRQADEIATVRFHLLRRGSLEGGTER
ncbi:MAG: hypothetical protein KatS3mg060_2770 [Dehalococcoidia bacterium]|jgi:flagellar export protein FliJ|nr:MAG: hypothetical protein KatS3mg060_2770 [Dehalococcoidia bacterium]